MIKHKTYLSCRAILLALIGMLIVQYATSQQLRLIKTAIATGYHSSLGSPLSATIGQSGPISSMSSNGLRIYQGFEHPFAFQREISLAAESVWELFPNPARDRVQIKNPTRPVAPCRVEVSDLHGALIWTQLISDGESDHAVSLDILHLVPGAYLIKLISPVYPPTVLKLIKL